MVNVDQFKLSERVRKARDKVVSAIFSESYYELDGGFTVCVLAGRANPIISMGATKRDFSSDPEPNQGLARHVSYSRAILALEAQLFPPTPDEPAPVA